MINFATLQGLAIPEGVVTQIADAAGNVLWSANVATNEPPAIFEVAKQTETTYAGETKYENEQFILFDIYPKKGGTVNITYGGLTKTVTDTSGAEEPNAIQIFFGTFNGVSDSVSTPDSGRLTIEGAYRGYGLGSFGRYSGKSSGAYAQCITSVIDMGNPAYIGSYTFDGCTSLALTSLPSGLTEIGSHTFYGCTSLALTEIPEGVVDIGDQAFRMLGKGTTCAMFGKTIVLPSTLKSIGSNAFSTTENFLFGGYAYYGYLGTIILRSQTPPALADEEVFGKKADYYGGTTSFIVPAGTGEAYRTAEYWSAFSDQITEAS